MREIEQVREREREREREHRVRESHRDRDHERRVPATSHMAFQPPPPLPGPSLMSPAGLRTPSWSSEHESRRSGPILSPQHARRSPPAPLRRAMSPPLLKGPGVGPPTTSGGGTYTLAPPDRSGRDHLNLAPIMPSQMQPAMPNGVGEMGSMVPAVGGAPNGNQ